MVEQFGIWFDNLSKNQKIEFKKLQSYFKTKKLLFASWSCENKFYSTMTNWHNPLKRFFKNIVVFDPQKYQIQEGKEKMNKHFIKILKKEKPDYILLYNDIVGRGGGLSPDTLFKVKEILPNIKIIDFHGDSDTNFDENLRLISVISDFILVAQVDMIKKYKKDGIKNIFPFYSTADPEVFKSLNKEIK